MDEWVTHSIQKGDRRDCVDEWVTLFMLSYDEDEVILPVFNEQNTDEWETFSLRFDGECSAIWKKFG